MAKPKKVPLFIADVGAIVDGDIDEWAERVAEYISQVTGLPMEEDDPPSDVQSPSDDQDVS